MYYVWSIRNFIYNFKKSLIVCVGHFVTRINTKNDKLLKLFPTITTNVLKCFEFLCTEYFNYPGLIIDSLHDFVKSITPIIKSINQILEEIANYVP